MKKLILGLLVGLLPVTLVYAGTDTDLLKEEIGVTIEAEVEAQAVENNQNKILQEYIDLCGGNEKLGKILYDKRKGETAKADALGKYVVARKQRLYYESEGYLDVSFLRWGPFQTAESIHHCYPDGMWVVRGNSIIHFSGPLAGILTYEGSRVVNDDFLGIDLFRIIVILKYNVYNENGEIVYSNKINNEYYKRNSYNNAEVRVRTYLFDFKGNVFNNEEDAQKYLNIQLTKRKLKEKVRKKKS